MQLNELDNNIKPWVITKLKVGVRITLQGGEDIIVCNSMSEVYSYYGLERPKLSLVKLFMVWTGLHRLMMWIAYRKGLKKLKDPELLRLIKGKSPARKYKVNGKQ